jgi:glycosyl transferase family 25
MINSLLNNIWIINLDKSKDRMVKIKNNFDLYGVKYNRFSAVYGKNVSKDYLDNDVSLICKTLLCNYGIIGCAASHKLLWKQLVNSESNAYIILEDDIEINENFVEIINKVESYLDKFKIDYLNLNCINLGCSIGEIEFTIDNYNFGKPYTPFQTNSYIITKNGATKLLNYLNKTNYHIDFEILYTKLFKDLNYYTISPSLVNLTNDETTIGINKKTVTSTILETFDLQYVAWFLNIPLLTINLFYEINCLMILLLILFLANNNNSKIIYLFIGLEFLLLNLVYL